MFGRLRAMFGHPRQRSARLWRHISSETWPAAIYAIGDIHGCLEQLIALEKQIEADAIAFEGEKWLLYLGDYLDRGPHSAGVIDHLLAQTPPGFRRKCLGGNHELMALTFLQRPNRHSDWLDFGGAETLASYGIAVTDLNRLSQKALQDRISSHIPGEHVEFLENLALTISVPGLVFVHAGIRVGVPLDRQSEHDLLWIRDEFFDAGHPPGPRIVHGHTPGAEVVIRPERICVDTGAFATGILSAVRLTPGAEPKIFTTTK